MALTPDEQAARTRAAGYNGNKHDPVTNPLGLAGTGYQENGPKAWNDTATLANATSRLADEAAADRLAADLAAAAAAASEAAAKTSETSAAASAGAGAVSAADAQYWAGIAENNSMGYRLQARTDFPTTKLELGILVLRTDLGQLYQLTSLTGPVWSLVVDFADLPAEGNISGAVVRRGVNGDFAAGTIQATLAGNADSASRLATACSINGVPFDGSADITANDTRIPTGTVAQAGYVPCVTADGLSYELRSPSEVVAAAGDFLTLAGGTLTGGIEVKPAADKGSVGLVPGDLANPGYVEFRTADGIRRGYAGWQSGAKQLLLSGETGWTWRVNTALTVGDGGQGWVHLTDDDSPNGRKSLHANSNLIGFIGGDGGWKLHVNETGQVHAHGYGWLHDYFVPRGQNWVAHGDGGVWTTGNQFNVWTNSGAHRMSVNQNGHVWTTGYGWLHEKFAARGGSGVSLAHVWSGWHESSIDLNAWGPGLYFVDTQGSGRFTFLNDQSGRVIWFSSGPNQSLIQCGNPGGGIGGAAIRNIYKLARGD